ncbi:MAG: hypothetical protein JOZ69_07320, partial [Myxococcales bacterium]|nr:hypothetical protein [Myxococcales bacterium]
ELGDVALLDFGTETAAVGEAEEAGEDEGEYGFSDAPERGDLDGGEEGPVDADEELREADLPALDADEDGDLDDAALVDPTFASEEPLGLPWAAQPWSRVGAPVGIARATAVACVPRGALVVGRLEGGAPELVRVDLEGSCDRLPAEDLRAGEVRAISVEARLVAAVLQGGQLRLSADGGRLFWPVVEPLAGGVAASDAVVAAGRLWVVTRTGGLLVTVARDPAVGLETEARPTLPVDADGSPVERCPVPGIAVALARDPVAAARGESGIAALVVDDRARPTALVRAEPGGPMSREMLDGPEARSPGLLAVRGLHAAYAARHGGVVRRGTTQMWQPFSWEGTVTALAFVDDRGTLLCATYSDADDTTAFVRVDAGGDTSVVARVGGVAPDSESDGRVMAMAHDEARGVVWAAGGFGLVTFAVR